MSWLTLVGTEVILLWRSRMVGLYLVVALGLLSAVLTLNPGSITEVVPRVTTGLLVIQLPILALGLAPALTRTSGDRGDLLWATPLALPVVATARLAAAGSVVSGVLLLTAGVTGLILGWRSGDLFLNGGYLGATLLRLLLPISLIQVLFVHALTYLWPRLLWPILACVGLTFVMTLGSQLTVLSLVHPLNFGLVTLSFNTVLGLGADGFLQARLAFFYGPVALALWLGSLYWVSHRDSRQGWPPSQDGWYWGIAGANIGLVLLAGGLYVQGLQQRIVPATITSQADTWDVLSAHHQAQIDGTALTVESQLHLHNIAPVAQTTIDLVLNPGLQVQEAALNGHTAQFRRQGEVVALSRPDLVLTPQTDLEIQLRYGGSPVLLREDYGAVVSVPFLPPAFARAAVNYLDRRSLFWLRDTDWLAWPLRSDPHVSRDTQTIAVALEPEVYRGSLISTAHYVEPETQGATRVWHHWSSPIPALLLAAGPFQRLDRAPGTLRLGRFQAAGTFDRASQLLAWSQQLETQRDQRAAQQTLVTLPYGTRILFAPEQVLVPESRLALTWGPGINTTEKEQLLTAIHLTADWLQEEIPWAWPPMTFDGRIRGYDSDCTELANGQWDCAMVLPRSRNPQAPHQRWLPHPEPPLWLQAFAVVLTHRTLFTEAHDLIDSERQAWEFLAEASEASLTRKPAGMRDNVEADPCALAGAVLSLHQAVDAQGEAFLWQWLDALEPHAPYTPIDEAALWRIGAAVAGTPLAPVQPPCHTMAVPVVRN